MIVALPNGQELEFPDGTAPDVMRNAIYKHFPEYAPKSKETPSVSSDIVNSIAGIPASLIDFITNLPGQVTSSVNQVSHNPLRASENLGAGLLEGIKGGINIPSNIASYMQSRDIGNNNEDEKYWRDLISKAHIPDTGLEKAILGENQLGDELLRSLGSFAPYARAGGLARGLGGAARRAGSAGAYAIGQQEDPLNAALLGLSAEGITRGIQGVTRKGAFLPSSPLTNEELRESANITKGTETGLGNVIENPFLQRQFENVFPNLPFSGANQAMQRTANNVKNRGENILNELKGKNESMDIGNALFNALKSSAEETRKMKNEKFNILNEAADKEGIKTDRSNLLNTAKDTLKEIEDDPHLASLTDSTARGILHNIVNEKDRGNYSLKKTDLLRGKIGKKINDAYKAGNTDLRDILRPLKEAATKDINDAIDSSNSEHLNDLRDKAMEFYKQEYAPFKEPEIEKFTIRGGDPDLLVSSFLKKSTVSDRGKLLEKLTSKLTDDQRKLLAYSYFSKAIEDGQLNPNKLKTRYKDLGEKQKKSLLSADELKKLRDYSALVQKNTEPLNIMFNPKTGQRNLSDYLIAALTGSTGLAAGGLIGGLMGALAPGLIARPFTKALTNPSIRERLIDRMIKSREKEPTQESNIAPFIQMLTQTIGR